MNTLRQISSNSVEFRPMCEDDLATVMRIETRAYAFAWTRNIFKDCIASGYHCLVICITDDAGHEQIIGHSVLSAAAGEAHLLNVCICRDSQGMGYGRQLVQHMLDLARALKVEVVFLEVRPTNRVAVDLYDSLGFNEIGTRKNYYPAHTGHEDAKVFALQLNLD
jgi:ribosomal-protein-alanine N-acetyltransferase